MPTSFPNNNIRRTDGRWTNSCGSIICYPAVFFGPVQSLFPVYMGKIYYKGENGYAKACKVNLSWEKNCGFYYKANFSIGYSSVEKS